MEPDLFEKFYTKALWFLSTRPRSEKEIRDSLFRKKASPEVIDKIIIKLTEQKYINDSEFAKWWIEQRMKFRPRGMRAIKIELKQKGISEVIIAEQLLVDTSEIEMENAKKIVESKIYKYKGLTKFEIVQKLGPTLIRRGFDYDTTKEAINSVLSEADSPESIGVDENSD